MYRRRVRRLAIVATIALVAAAPAAARTVVLKPGQGFRVTGTDYTCTYGGRAASSGGLGCRRQGASGPVVGSYSFGFGPQSLSVGRFASASKYVSVFSKEQPGAPAAAKFPRDYFDIRIVGSLRAGDAVSLAGTKVRCTISGAITCALAVPGTFSASLDSQGVVVRRGAKVILEKRHGH